MDDHDETDCPKRIHSERCGPAAAVPEAQDGRERYGVTNGWLFEYVNEHTCGTGRDGYYGAHEPDCSTVPIARIEDLLTPSAAVREGERERLAALGEYLVSQGLPADAPWDRILMHIKGNAGLTAANNAYAEGIRYGRQMEREKAAPPSLAAPEGTEQ